MNKLILSLTALLVCANFSYAQHEKITGNWLVEQIEYDGKIEHPNMITEFTQDGKMIMMGIEVAIWNYNKKNNEIVMKSDFDKDFNGNGKIISITDEELIINKDKTKVTYQKLDLEKIAVDNQNSGFIGEWEYGNNDNSGIKSLIIFRNPDEFTMIHKEEYMETTVEGTWIFNKKANTLLMIGFSRDLLPIGKNKVIKRNTDSFELQNRDGIFTAIKKINNKKNVESTINVEHLTFYYEDFFTEDGDEKYAEDREKLPWNNWKEMKKDLLNINQLVYSYEFNDEDTKVFKTELLTTDVIANIEDEGFTIEDIFKGYDNSGNPEQGPNTDYNNPLYPLINDYTYRVAGNEQITTPAGTFDCTVIEVSNGYDMKKKLWMINDKVGVYAKIIDENTSEYSSYYHLYELQEIINK